MLIPAATTVACPPNEARMVYHRVDLDDGRVVALFINRETCLVVLDVVDADDLGGVEVYRRALDGACPLTWGSRK